MATTFDITNAVDVTAAANFIPEVWSMETVASYKANLVVANLVKRMNHVGKKGDTVHIPAPDRDAAVAKTANNFVDIIAHTDSLINVSINQHWTYGRLLEDIAAMQGLTSLRSFFTEDAGYALAKRVDTVLHQLAATWGGATAYVGAGGAVIGSDGATAWSATANTNTGNGTAIADAGVRAIHQDFDDGDVPVNGRVIVVPPVAANSLRATSRYTEQAFVGSGDGITKAPIADLYGAKVYVSSNCETVQAADSSTNYRAALFFHRDAMVLVEQQKVRVQEQYRVDALGTLIVADTVFGAATLRGRVSGDAGVGSRAIIVPA